LQRDPVIRFGRGIAIASRPQSPADVVNNLAERQQRSRTASVEPDVPALGVRRGQPRS
jgi:hypothetical protein